ncbi:MAG: zf-HC2 domain-containing protein [Deltaproteobacteria bacterium]|nr:zf-HC2 domain-containing protein [Deltaproteobacteria bacterium]
MTCGEVRDRIAPFLDGQLSEIEAREVAAHLETCEACRRLVLVLGRQSLGPSVPMPVRPQSFWGSMDRALEEAARRPLPRTARWKAWWSSPVTLSRWTVALLLALLTLAVGLHLVRGEEPTPPLPIQAQGPMTPGYGLAPASHTPVRHRY